jgi:CheY-like chemotaxis protein
MPDISGIDVTKYFRQKKNNKSTKIVAVTAAVMKDDIKKYYNAGINDFLIKPYKEIHLFNKMCEVLKIKKAPFPKPAAEIILKEEIHPKLYNLSELKKMTGNNNALIAKMLSTFIKNSKTALQKFNSALVTKDSNLIAETAHKILPSFRHLDVYYIVKRLIELKEISRKEADFNVLGNATEKVIQAIEKLLKELKTELQHFKKID